MPVTCRKIGKRFRILGPNGEIEKTKKGNAVDGGGHSTKSACGLQARAINANTQNVKHPLKPFKRTEIVPSNPLKADPTRTKTLRDKFTREITKRFRKLKSAIIDLIVREDAFGLKGEPKNPFLLNEERDDENERSSRITLNTDKQNDRRAVGNGIGENDTDEFYDYLRTIGAESRIYNTRFAFQSDPAKVESFRKWLTTQFSVIVPPRAGESLENQWWTRFVEEGYRKGAGRAFDDTQRARRALATTPEQLSFFEGTKEQFLQQSFGRAVAVEKVQLLAGRVFTELKGVTDAMAQSLTRELTQGLAQGDNPLTIARRISQSIENIPIRRARAIARTEIIRAHAEGQLDAMEQMGLEEVGVMVEWSTAGDDRVCPLCSPMDGVVFKIKEARGLIPRHTNCRCAHIPANVGESKAGQIRSKTAAEKSLRESIKAEIPKGSTRSIAAQRRLSKWPGADLKVAKKRPKGIV